MAVKSFEEYEKELKKSYAPQEAAAIAANEQKYATEKKLTTDTYNRQIDETSKSYEDLYDENAVQRLVNEREVAENMANLGLTDSGLNRTQQTAVQLSYANSKNKIDVTRQKAIDTLTAQLADAITKLDIEQNDNAASIKSNYAALASSGAQDMYNNAVQEETKRIQADYDYRLSMYKEQQKAYEKQQAAYEKQLQAQKEASYIIKTNGGTLRRDYTGSLKDNGVSVIYNGDTTTYIDNNSGKKTIMPIWKNPYTNSQMHNDLKDKEGNYDSSKAFSNGYQPNNINGEKLKAAKRTDNGNTATSIVNGRTQTIFQCSSGYYLWHGAANQYERLTRAECIQRGIYVDKWYDQ
ncbi:MAG: hypothetical protein U0L66_05175 [Acutalibacteraceae bacterium]|nr:hypothetical protein [Acutalibacteraceae bacterium]